MIIRHIEIWRDNYNRTISFQPPLFERRDGKAENLLDLDGRAENVQKRYRVIEQNSDVIHRLVAVSTLLQQFIETPCLNGT